MIPPSRPLGIANAIATGWLVVNVPVLLIMLASLVIGWAVEPTLWWLFFSAGVILAWTWVSFGSKDSQVFRPLVMHARALRGKRALCRSPFA